ncbi:MAG: OmpA family protein [Bacteroidota bacterium]
MALFNMGKQIKTVLIIVFVKQFSLNCISQTTASPNFVLNPSFEEYYECPNEWRGYSIKYTKKIVPFWIVPTRASVDYFNKCSRKKSGIPDNWAGSSYPANGDGYIGIITGDTTLIGGLSFGYHEFIQTELMEPLHEDSLYVIRINIQTSKKCAYSVNKLGVLFTEGKFKPKRISSIRNKENLNQLSLDGVNRNDWLELCDTIKVTGKPKYLTIGQLSLDYSYSDENHEWEPHAGSTPYSYHLLDDLSLEKLSPKNGCFIKTEQPKTDVPVESVRKDSLNDDILHRVNYVEIQEEEFKKNVENEVIVFFESNSAVLNPKSLSNIEDWLTQLDNSNRISLMVSGHTDASGTDSINDSLSLTRAQSVLSFIKLKCPSCEIIKAEAKGSSEPDTENTSTEGRAMNRRVEIRVL